MEIPELLSLDAGWNILSLGTGEIQFGYWVVDSLNLQTGKTLLR